MSASTMKESDKTTASAKNKHRCVDIGINLTQNTFKKHWRDVVHRAVENGVETMLLTGTSLKGSRQSQSLAQQWYDETPQKNLYFTVGVHPHDAKHFGSVVEEKTVMEHMRELLQTHPLAVAAGECGLDYNRNFSSKKDQLYAFQEQVRLACELQLPLFVHEREAHQDLVTVLEKFGADLPPVVVHCFTGTREEAMSYLEKGYYIGFTGFICKQERGKEIRQFLSEIPLDRIMIETDAPFMGFKKGKKRHSEPAHVVDVARKIAEVHRVPFEEVCEVTTRNSLKFFRIDD